MANATDTRIIQMMFDNKQFERNIKVSENSLEKFKKTLDFNKCEKGLDNLSESVKKIDFSKAAENLQKLTDKFTGLGTVSELVLSQIRRGIESVAQKASSLIKSLSFEQIGAGMEKFEYLNKNIQTIMAATGKSEEEVTKVMKRLNEYTDQTSYSFTDMASNIGKFTSVGIPLEKAEKQMEGIANWAARSGAGITEASRAMYNLSQAMGAGKLLKIDWKSIENAGMATQEFKEQLIQAGIAAGTLEVDKKGIVKTAKSLGKQVEVTYKNMSETLSKGWANTDVLGNTLQKYYYDDLYYTSGEKALIELSETQKTAFDKMIESDKKLTKEEYKTLENMGFWTDDTKQKILDLAVSMGKLSVTTDKEGKKQYEAVAKNGKKVQFTIENMADSLATGWFDKGLYDTATSVNELAKSSYEAAQKCKSFTDVIQAWKDQLSTGWMNFWQHIFGGLGESMEIFSNICNKVGESFSDFTKILVGGYEMIEDESGNMQKVWKEGIFENWANLGGRNSLWAMFIGEYDGMYEGAYGFLDVLKDIGGMISDGFWMMIKMMNPKLDTVSDEAWLENDTYRVQELGFMLMDATEKVRNFIQGIKNFMTEVSPGQTKTRFQQIQDVVRGAMSIAVIVYNTVKDIIGFISVLLDQNHLGPAVNDIITIFSMLGQELSKAAGATSRGEGLAYFLNGLLNVLGDKNRGLIKAFNDFIGFIKDLIGWTIGLDSQQSHLIKLWKLMADFLTKTLARVSSALNHVLRPVIDFFEDLLTAGKELVSGRVDFTAFVDKLKSAVKKAVNAIFNFTDNFTGKIREIFEQIKEVFRSGFSSESLSTLWTHIKNLMRDLFGALPEGIQDGFREAKSRIQAFFKPFFDDLKNVFTSSFSGESIQRLKDRLKIIWAGISEKIPSGVKEGFRNTIARIRGFFQPFIDDISFAFSNAFSGESIQRLKERLKSIFQGITNLIPQGIKDGVKEAIQKIKNFFQPVIDSMKSLFENGLNGEVIDSLKENLKTFLQKVKSVLTIKRADGSEIDLSKILLGVVGVLGLAGILKLIRGIKKASNTASGIKIGSIAKIGLALYKVFGAFLPGISAAAVKVGESLSGSGSIFEQIVVWIKDGISRVTGFVSNLFGGKFNLIDTIKEKLGLTADSSVENDNKVSIFDSILEWIRNQFAAVKNKFNNFIKDAESKVGTFGHAIVTFFKTWGSKILLAVVGILGLAIIIKLVKKVIYLINTIADSVKLLSKACKDGLKSLTQGFLRDTETFGDKVLKFAGALAILAACVYVIGSMDRGGPERAALVITAMAIVLTAMSFLMKQIYKDVDLDKGKEMVLGSIGMAAALLILAYAVEPLSKIKNLDQASYIMLTLGVILAELVAFTYFISKIDDYDPEQMYGILALCAGLAAIVYVLTPLVKERHFFDMFGKMMLTLFGFLALLGVFVAFVSHMSGGLGDKGLIQLAAVALAVGVLVYALMPLKDMSDNQILQMVKALMSILALVAAFTIVAGEANKLASGSLWQVAVLALAISALMWSFLPLALVNQKDIDKVLNALGQITVILIILMAAVAFMNKYGASMKDSGLVSILAVAGAVLILVLALLPLTLLDPVKMVQALGGIFALLTMITLFILAVNNVNTKGVGIWPIIGLVGAIVVLTLMLIPLSLMAWEDLAKSVLSLVALMGMMALLANQVSKLKSGKSTMAGLAIVAAMAGVIYVLGETLKSLKGQDWKLVASFTAGVAALMFVMGKLMQWLSNLTVKGAATAVGAIAALFLTLALVIPIFIRAIADALSDAGADLAIMSGLIETFTNRMAGINEGDISKSENIVYRLKDLAGEISGFAGFKSDFGPFTTMLYDLGTTMESFATRCRRIGDVSNNSAVALIKDLAGCANDLDTVTKLNIDELTSKITGLGGAMILYARGAKEMATEAGIEGVDDIDESAIAAAVEIMKSISEKLADKDGIVIPEKMPDPISLGLFGAQLAALAGALIEFEKAGQGLGEGKDKALEVLDYFQQLKERLDSTKFIEYYNEVTGSFTKEKIDMDSLGEFSKNIEKLGQSLHEFSQLTTEPIQDVELSGEAAASVQAGLVTFNESMNAVSEATNVKRKPIDFSSALDVLDQFVALKDRLPTTAWYYAIIGRKQTLKELGKEVEQIGIALKDFSTNVTTGFDPISTSIAITALNQMIDFMSTINDRQLPRIGGLFDDIQAFLIGSTEGQDWTLKNVSDAVGEMGGGLKKLGQALKEGHWDENLGFDSAIDTLTSVVMLITELDTLRGAFGSDVHGYIYSLGQFMSELNDSFNNSDDSSPSILNMIVQMMHNLSSEIAKFGDIDESKMKAFYLFAEAIIDLANLNRDADFELIGKKMTDAMKYGIEKGASGVINALVAVALDAYKAGLSALDLQMQEAENALEEKAKKNGVSLTLPVEVEDETPTDISWDAHLQSAEEMKQNASWGFPEYADTVQEEVQKEADKNPIKVELSADANISQNDAFKMFGLDGIDTSALLEKMGLGTDISGADLLQTFKGMDNFQWTDLLTGITGGEDILNSSQFTSMFGQIGNNGSLGVAEGFLDGKLDVNKAISEVGLDGINTLENLWKVQSPSKVFMQIGRYASLGLALGIRQKSKSAFTSAIEMINGIIDITKKTAKIQSPSRVFMEIGEYLGAGLTVGLENSSASVTKASIAMANSSINAMKEALGIHSPSTEAAELGGYIIDGYRQGIEKEEKNLHTMLEGVGGDSLDAMQEGWQSAAKNDPLFSLKAAQFKLDTNHDETVKNGVETYLNDLSRAGEQEVKKQVLRRNYFSNFWRTLQTALYAGMHDGRLPDKTRPSGITTEQWDDFSNNVLAPILAGMAFGTVGAEHAVRKTVETQAQHFNFRIIRWAWGAYKDVKKGINEAIPGIIQGYGQFVGKTFGKSNETAVENIAENLVPSAEAESDAKNKVKKEAPNFFANLAKFAGSFMRNNFKGSENSDLDFWGNLISGGLTPSAKAESDSETKIKEEAPNFMASLTQIAGDFIRNNFKGVENSDLDFWGNLISGIINPPSQTATDTEQKVAQTADDFFSGLAKEFIGAFSHGSVSSLGGLLIDSVIGGMNSEEQAILNTMEAIMLGTKAKAFDTVEAHSPSEVFTQLGEFMMIGLGNGIENKSGEVGAKVQRVMDHLINLTGGPLANLNALLESEIDTTPTITPVLNLSGVESGIQAMNGMFGDAPFGLALNSGMLSIDPSSASLLANSFVPKDYTVPIQDIQNEVGELRSDIQTLSESMRQMKFVFHTGQVVAAIGPEMDQYLGQQGYYAVRGEIP